MKATETAIRAMSIIKAEPHISGTDMAYQMWPSSIRAPQGAARLGGGYMKKLINAGWVIEGCNRWRITANGLTRKGEIVLESHAGELRNG